MIKKSSVFDFLNSVMVIYGVSVLSLCFFASLFGESAREVSSMFRLGEAGLTIATLMQFLLLAFCIAGLRILLFTDKVIKNVSIAVRTIAMFAGVLAVIAVSARVFGWFPIDMARPWIMFFACFAVCASVSVGISVIKDKTENQKMQEALERLKGEEK